MGLTPDVSYGEHNPFLPRHDRGWRFALSADGHTLATSTTGPIQLWAAGTGEKVRRLHGHWFTDEMAFSPDGRVLVARGTSVAPVEEEPPIVFWEVTTGKELRRLSIHLYHLAFSPDGKFLVGVGGTTTANGEGEALYFWEVATSRLRRVMGLPSSQGRTRFLLSPDGKTLVPLTIKSLDRKTYDLGLWEVATGHERLHWELPDDAWKI